MQGAGLPTKARAQLVLREAFVALMQRQLAATNGILDPSQALARVPGALLKSILDAEHSVAQDSFLLTYLRLLLCKSRSQVMLPNLGWIRQQVSND